VKVNLVNVVMLSGGIILLYSGIKGYDPRDVIRWGLGGKKPKKMESKEWDGELGDPKDHPDPGQRYPGDLGIPDPNEVPAKYI